ncbi:MAG: iron-sulfur cluster assembly scaffold protein [Candidatus Shapirobacteria bacterium]|jgi:nitrogen fixation NifU-like protein
MITSSYSPQVLTHFRHPHNFGSLKKPDSIGQVGNPVCGDVMKIYLKIGRDKEGEKIIKNIKFETLGCTAAIATSSVVTDLAKGKTLKSALQITRDDVIKVLGRLPATKVHCSLLAVDALKKAINIYQAKPLDKPLTKILHL